MAILKKMQENSKANGGQQSYNAFGVVFGVKTAQQVGDSLELTGNVLNKNENIGPDELLTVRFRGDSAGKSLTNFLKGNGKGALKTDDAAAGTFLTLEGCYLVPDEKDGNNRILSARWLNTLSSSRSNDHDNRSFLEEVMATAPRISFKNVNPLLGEPERITLSVNAKKVVGRVKNEHGTFNKDFPVAWAVEKLAALPNSEKPLVTIDTIEPSSAVAVTDEASLKAVLEEQLARGTKALALLRISDGEDVLTRAVYVQFKKDGDDYVPDVDKALEDLFKNNIFKGVPNADLFAGLADGSLKFESIPGYRMSYAGDPTKDDNAAFKLISDVKKGLTQRYEMIFGTDPNGYANVILPGIARNNDIGGFSPFNILAEKPGTFLADQFNTPLISPNAEPKPVITPTDEAGPAPDFGALETQFDQEAQRQEEPEEAAGHRP